MKENGSMINGTDSEYLQGLMETDMRDSSRMAIDMAKESSRWQMVKSITETGSIISGKERESGLIQTAISMKETSSIIKEKAMEHTISLMVISIKDSGRMEN